jgi:UDP-glucose 4-epimerase
VDPGPRTRRTRYDIELGGLEDIGRVIEEHRIDLLLIGFGVSRVAVVDAVMRSCDGDAVRLCDLAAFYEDVFGHVPITEIDSAWLQLVLHPRFRERRSQRACDLVVAGVLGVACLPLLLPLALLIRRDGGPALYRQPRTGRAGRRFVIYKLRTMRWEGSEETERWWCSDDPRVTLLGRFLRRTHVDELPQLFNVLRGDMTLVGPRPEQPEIAARLQEVLALWRGRYRHKPGLTGWAQIRAGYGGSDEGSAWKLAHDLYYLRRRSLALDIAILARTAFIPLFAPRNADTAGTPFVVRRTEPQAPAPQPLRLHSKPRKPRAVVTGGAGFIGSHLVDGLLAAGYDVLAVDDLSTGCRDNLAEALQAGAELYEGDVTSPEAMRRCFLRARPEVVFHLAARIDVARAVEEPLDDAGVNVAGTLAVLEAARVCGARRLVLASSGGAVYGDAAVIPTPEHSAVAPLSPYGAGKAAAELYAALYGPLYSLATVSLRLANVYGPRQGVRGDGGVVARLCRAKVTSTPAVVFGDGRQTRDYVYVRDVVDAFIAAASSPVAGVLNVGTACETSVLELVRALGVRAEFRPARPGEVRRSALDCIAAARHLGWAARTPLPQGLAETLAFSEAAWEHQAIAV